MARYSIMPLYPTIYQLVTTTPSQQQPSSPSACDQFQWLCAPKGQAPACGASETDFVRLEQLTGQPLEYQFAGINGAVALADDLDALADGEALVLVGESVGSAHRRDRVGAGLVGAVVDRCA
jgi:hypothetical protein